MSARIRQYVIALGCVLALAPAAVAKPPELSHNPFTRPPSERTTPLPDRRSESPDSAQLLDLRATMVGTRDRLANVGGRILRPGDEIQGYTLIKVYEDRAIFDRQGKQKTIYVKPDPVDSDE